MNGFKRPAMWMIDWIGRTPPDEQLNKQFFNAARSGTVADVERLLAAGAFIDWTPLEADNGERPVSVCFHSNAFISGCPPDPSRFPSNYALLAACFRDSTFALSCGSACLVTIAPFVCQGATALSEAACLGRDLVVARLLTNNADGSKADCEVSHPALSSTFICVFTFGIGHTGANTAVHGS